MFCRKVRRWATRCFAAIVTKTMKVMPDRHEAPCPGHPCVRVCQEPFPPWTERHRLRSPPETKKINGMSSCEQCGRGTWINYVHLPRKTGEEQLLHLAVPTLRQRNCESSSAVPGWTDTHCVLSYTRKGSSPENAGSVKLINVLKLDVAQVSVSRQKCVLQCSDGSTTPRCDATHLLQARRQITRRATANCDSPHQRSVDATRNRPYCK